MQNRCGSPWKFCFAVVGFRVQCRHPPSPLQQQHRVLQQLVQHRALLLLEMAMVIVKVLLLLLLLQLRHQAQLRNDDKGIAVLVLLFNSCCS